MGYLVPTVLEKEGSNERSFDLYSRLLRDRLIFCNGEVEENMAEIIVAQLLYLDSQDSTKPISMYINSPGGSITAGCAIMDTMDYIVSPVRTIALGHAASMGAVLLSAGEKGMRCALPKTRILLHMASSGASGNIQDMEKTIEETKLMNEMMLETLSKNTSKDIKELRKDLARDYWLSAEEAVKYGVIDKVIKKI
jgi:ATP-dependent Clp protease protease subunit